MSPKILRMRFFLELIAAPADLPVASDALVAMGGGVPLRYRCAGDIRREFVPCTGRLRRTPKRRRHYQAPSGTGAAALFECLERNARRFLPWLTPHMGPPCSKRSSDGRHIGRGPGDVKPAPARLIALRPCRSERRLDPDYRFSILFDSKGPSPYRLSILVVQEIGK